MCINSFSPLASHHTHLEPEVQRGYSVRRSGASRGPQQSGVRAHALVHTVTHHHFLMWRPQGLSELPDANQSARREPIVKQQPVLPTTQEMLFFSHQSVLSSSQRAEKDNPKNLAAMGINTPPPCALPPSGSLRISECWKQVTSSCMFSWQRF